ncbi:MAG: replication initiator protein [Arizlama microvirus]|nr:MAG: replication initiator protein [Arizlama microvirus]
MGRDSGPWPIPGGGEGVKGVERKRPLTSSGGCPPPLFPAPRRGSEQSREAGPCLSCTSDTHLGRKEGSRKRKRRLHPADPVHRKAQRRENAHALARGASFEHGPQAPGSRQAPRKNVLHELHGDCTSPKRVSMETLCETDLVRTVRCRKCEACGRARKRQWIARAITESFLSERTWFVTLTLRPAIVLEHQPKVEASTRFLEAKTVEDKVSAWDHHLKSELQQYLKRVRKNSHGRIRYMQVVEAHASGLPHWHILVHETSARATSKLCLRTNWHMGFTHARLATATDIFYVCKYAAKSAPGRLRASQRYGRPVQSPPQGSEAENGSEKAEA